MSENSAPAADVSKVGRDVRVDVIGFAEELAKQFARPERDKLKKAVAAKGLAAVEGDFFRGELRGAGGSIKTISPRRFFDLIKSGRITQKQFLDCISVERGKAEEYLGDRDLDAISDEIPTGPSFWIFRKRGVEPQLVSELEHLGKTLQEK
jgi:hypothetical protein